MEEGLLASRFPRRPFRDSPFRSYLSGLAAFLLVALLHSAWSLVSRHPRLTIPHQVFVDLAPLDDPEAQGASLALDKECLGGRLQSNEERENNNNRIRSLHRREAVRSSAEGGSAEGRPKSWKSGAGQLPWTHPAARAKPLPSPQAGAAGGSDHGLGGEGEENSEGEQSSITDSLEWTGEMALDRETGEGPIPLVTLHVESQDEGVCKEGSILHDTLKEVRSSNDVVHLIGPAVCALLEDDIGVRFEPWASYNRTVAAFREELGVPKPIHARWYILKSFMERHNYSQVFYFEPDIKVLANITQFVDELLDPEERHIMLLQAAPDLYSPEVAALKWATLLTSGQTSLWSYRGLLDFLAFHKFFFTIDVLHGRSFKKFLVEFQAYADTVILGWYAHYDCWRPGRDRRVCKPEPTHGFTLDRVSRTVGKFEVRFNVSSGLKPRLCRRTAWSAAGWCMLEPDDPTVARTAMLHKGHLCPVLPLYRGFHLWVRPEEASLAPDAEVQLLSVKSGKALRWYQSP